LLIEAFSEAKNPAEPAANEDALLILPDRAFAVIDGVSDRTGQRYDGMLAGRYAARLVQARLSTLLGGTGALPDAETIVTDLTACIAAEYARFGMAEKVAADWGGKIACTLALVLLRPDTLEVVLIGDSGVRLDGHRTLRLEKDVDRITALLRRYAWRAAAARTEEATERERVSRRVAFQGTGQDPAGVAPLLSAGDLTEIRARAMAACAAELPHLPMEEVATLVERGIVGGQGRHQNNGASPLGYSCLDGFTIPRSFMKVEQVTGTRTVELFTDGYFRPGDGFGVAAWETAFRAVEAEDPAKLGRYLSPRGSTEGTWADDRSYLGARF
jgi:hypothetical protein